MRGENARLGVETTTRGDRTARSAIKSRSTLSIDQWRTARPERNRLEKSNWVVQGWGAVHSTPRLKFRLDKKRGQRHGRTDIGTESYERNIILAGRMTMDNVSYDVIPLV